MQLRTLYWTAADRMAAVEICRTLVQEKLVACANVVDGVTSVYEWQDVLHEDSEVAVLAKTTAANVSAAIQRIEELHSYDCPCVVAWTPSAAASSYEKWVVDSVRGGATA